jgi:hypothetical protein
MTPEFIERAMRDYASEKTELDWDSYLAGYIACLKRFAGRREDRREVKSKQGYSRVGLKNV